MSRVVLASLLALSVTHVGCGADDDRPPPRHLILVSLDTLRADHLGFYGYERDTSPNLDALAARSVVFEEAIAQASATLPSHASLFQSRLPSHTGGGHPTLAQVLSEAGFRTAAFTGGGNVSAQLGFGRGFERYDETRGGFEKSFGDIEAWLRDAPEERFFLFLHTYDVHLPYKPPEPWDTAFFPEYGGRVNALNATNHVRHFRGIDVPDTFRPRPLDGSDRRKIVSLYDGEIAALDAWMGRLVTILEETGLLEQTLLVVLSDHGEEFWDHGSVLHSHTVHRELVRVPLVVHLPGDEHGGRRVRDTVRLLDVAPTALQLLGVPAPTDFTGRSLAPLLAGERLPPLPAVSETSRYQSLTAPPWKLIRDGEAEGGSGPLQLFDLREDLTELRDVLARDPDAGRRLAERLDHELGAAAVAPVRDDGTELADPALLEQLDQLGYVGGR